MRAIHLTSRQKIHCLRIYHGANSDGAAAEAATEAGGGTDLAVASEMDNTVAGSASRASLPLNGKSSRSESPILTRCTCFFEGMY